MIQLDNISDETVCNILKLPLDELTSIQAAYLRMLEAKNSKEEMEAMRSKARMKTQVDTNLANAPKKRM